MPQLTKKEHETVVRDIEAIDGYIRAAMDALDRKDKKQRNAWNQLDLAIPRLRGLSM
jgi:hypothetical protein